MGSLGRRSQTTPEKGHRSASLTGFVRDVSGANCSNRTGMGKHGGINTKERLFHHTMQHKDRTLLRWHCSRVMGVSLEERQDVVKYS